MHVNDETLFCTLASADVANFIASADRSVCYVAPGVQEDVAKALLAVVGWYGPEMVTVCLDFDEQVMRMGYGSYAAVAQLRNAGIEVRSAPGLRMAMVIVDHRGYLFTPTPLYLEAGPPPNAAPNAMRMSREQVVEALARLSPAAKAISVAQATTPEEKRRIEALPVDVWSEPVTDEDIAVVGISLEEAPPVSFDLARQVRVFEPYLQYVELSLSGAAIQRHRLAIPPNIQRLGGSKDIEGRLRTTFELIEKGGKFSSKPLEDDLYEIRKNFTPSLGKDHGRVVLKAAKPHLLQRLNEFRARLERHQAEVEAELQQHLDASLQQVVDYYVLLVVQNPPDALLGQLLTGKPTADDARRWLAGELNRTFPVAASLIQEMRLDVRFKDVTYETLTRKDFLESVKKAFPNVDWDHPYSEFKAAGEGR
ncbi:MAG: hypothetical protein Q7W53_17040 [Pseudomonadota bacterium]|nr:hypothetical protein [Pseudomonadota bacterium]